MEELLLLNPRRRRRVRRKRARRRNELEELLMLNPRRRVRRITGGRHRLTVYGTEGRVVISPKSRLAPRSRGRVLNPIVRMSDVSAVVGIGAGIVASRLVPKLIEQNLPDNLKVGIGKVAVQTASGLVVSFVVGNVLKRKDLGKLMLYGTLVNTAISLVDNFVLKGLLSAEELATLQQLPEQEQVVQQLPEQEQVVQQLPEQEEVVQQLPEEQYAEEIADLEQEQEQPIIIT